MSPWVKHPDGAYVCGRCLMAAREPRDHDCERAGPECSEPFRGASLNLLVTPKPWVEP